MPAISTLSSHHFLTTLAVQLLDKSSDPFTLSETLVLLPNRRSCRVLQEILLRQSEGKSVILPMLRPIGDVEEDELLFAETGSLAWDIPPPISALEQRVLLAMLIKQWQEKSDKYFTFDQASELAKELVRFLHEVEREQLPLENLQQLVPEHYAAHWQLTLSFLDIIATHWPAILQERNKTSPVIYRNLLLERLACHWEANPPEFPVIAAGSTGSIPATRRLLKVIASLPKGQVILPGLDVSMDEESWQAMDASHPQYTMKQLLEVLEAGHGSSLSLGERVRVRDLFFIQNPLVSPHPSPLPQGEGATVPRGYLIRELMRPAKTTDRWLECSPNHLQPALQGISFVEAASAQEEASIIALIMRESLETPGKKTVLVTHDRALAKRVKQWLTRWDITVDDSAGTALSHSLPGVFLLLLSAMVENNMAPVPLLSLLHHPLLAASEARENARLLELAALRGLPPAQGFGGIIARLLRNPEHAHLVEWLRGVEKACTPFITLMEQTKVPAISLLKAHIQAAEALATTVTQTGAMRLWGSEEGKQLSTYMEEMLQAVETMGEMETGSYTKFLRGLLASGVYRPRYGGHPRLALLSPQEARLLEADCVVIGGLNEGVWPPAVTSDPWMNMSMRKRFGLPLPEQKTGMAAHDFSQLLHFPEVILTRATKVDGKQAIASRWLQRLETLLSGVGLWDSITPQKPWHLWAKQLHEPQYYEEMVPPAPTPPLESRPNALFVTQVEKLMRDPYAIYASHILKLKPLEPLDKDVTRADFGNVIHAVLAQFAKEYDIIPPEQHLATLLAYGKQALKRYMEASPSAEIFWWARFERIATWFVAHEANKRAEGINVMMECEGIATLDINGKPFQLKARADRLETGRLGEITLVDYKTGSVPSAKDIEAGFACQMTLEGLIAEMGGFTGLGKVTALEYWKLIGGETAVELTAVKQLEERMREAGDGVRRLLDYFASENSAYLSEPWLDFSPLFSDYRHLARVKEWQGM